MTKLSDMNADELREYIKRIKRNAAKRRKDAARITNQTIAKYRDGVFGELLFLKPYGDPRSGGPGYVKGRQWTRLVLVGRDGSIYERAKYQLEDAFKLVDASNHHIRFKDGDPRRPPTHGRVGPESVRGASGQMIAARDW